MDKTQYSNALKNNLDAFDLEINKNGFANITPEMVSSLIFRTNIAERQLEIARKDASEEHGKVSILKEQIYNLKDERSFYRLVVFMSIVSVVALAVVMSLK